MPQSISPSPSNTDSSLRETANKTETNYSAVPGEDSEDASSPRASWNRRIVLDTWFPEVLAITVSIACLIAILAVLIAYDGKPSPYLPFSITLNAIVAILATTSRSLLLYVVAAAIGQLKWSWYRRSRKLDDIQTFDDASRGPWGSLNLLFSLRARPLASLGAVVTIFALAFDPFVQQILSYTTRLADLDSVEVPQLRRATELLNTTTDEWSLALSKGIWSEADTFTPRPSCPADSCEWNVTRSVGWCSKCQDALPYATTFNCSVSKDYDYRSDFSGCTVSFGHGNTLDVVYGQNIFPQDAGGGIWTHEPEYAMILAENAVWMLESLDTVQDGGANSTHVRVKSPVVALAEIDVELREDNTVHLVHAEECIISLCTTNTTVMFANGSSTVRETGMSFGRMIDLEYGYDNVCWSTDPMFYDPDQWELLTCPAGTMAMPEDLGNVMGIWDLLTGNLSKNLFVSDDFMYGRPDMVWSDPTATNVAKRGLKDVTASIAASLTQRGLADATERVDGRARSNQTFVDVTYYWLIFPAVLEIGGLILLIIAITHSRRHKIELWKSSILPFLFYGAEADVLDR